MNWNDAAIEHPDLASSTSGKIYDPALDKWTTVINSTDYRFAIVEISYSDTGIEGECLVSTADTVGLVPFTISRLRSLPIVTRFAAGRRKRRIARDLFRLAVASSFNRTRGWLLLQVLKRDTSVTESRGKRAATEDKAQT
jgi:hypothetical protein